MLRFMPITSLRWPVDQGRRQPMEPSLAIRCQRTRLRLDPLRHHLLYPLEQGQAGRPRAVNLELKPSSAPRFRQEGMSALIEQSRWRLPHWLKHQPAGLLEDL